MILRSTKSIKLIFFVGALFIAGLFYFLKQSGASEIKPSQLDFTKSNKIQELEPANIAQTEFKSEQPTLLPELSATEATSWQVFESILSSKNDNDPRLDTELMSLSARLHLLLIQKYHSLQMENRNGRGLISFLIARDFKSSEDAEFLKQIFQEAACTGFENCNYVGSEDPHFSGVNQISLNYPQMAALYQLEAQLESRPQILQNQILREGAMAIIKQAQNFPVPIVQNKAEQIKNRFGL